jgi:methionine sulfoxide reductase heme-binding subunit
MQHVLTSRPFLWFVLTFPAVWIVWRYATDVITYGQVIHQTGDLSVQLLIVTLAATPLRLMFPSWSVAQWLLRRRRELGVAVFGYALLHLLVYLLRKSDLGLILSEGAEIGLLTGWVAFVIFLPLALTSNDLSVRTMKLGWKKLHRLVYPAAILAMAHWLLTAFDPFWGIVHAAILAAVETARIVLVRQRRRAI